MRKFPLKYLVVIEIVLKIDLKIDAFFTSNI